MLVAGAGATGLLAGAGTALVFVAGNLASSTKGMVMRLLPAAGAEGTAAGAPGAVAGAGPGA